jgi:L-ribulokinase
MPKEDKMLANENYVIGADFGSDSVRCVVVDAANGKTAGSDVVYYPRWAKGLYCDPRINQFRQHPADYIESLTAAVRNALKKSGKNVSKKVRAICVDTTGSTPVLCDKNGTALSLLPQFAEDPDAMFILWKDHTAVEEADEINKVAHSWKENDYTKYEGGVYSSEWFWAKILHTIRKNSAVKNASYTAVEHCDWIPAILTGTTAPDKIKRSRCPAGHKVMWNAEWNGYPPTKFFDKFDKKLSEIRNSLGTETYTTDTSCGHLTNEWAEKLGLPESVIVTCGAFDCHIGAIGGDAAPGVLVKSIGTSTCDVIIGPKPAKGKKEKLVKGICGQVDGSVVGGYIGYEAGQSAYGDYYAWLRNIITWPLKNQNVFTECGAKIKGLNKVDVEAYEKNMIRVIEHEAEKIKIDADHPEKWLVALDWVNGRRTPFANQKLSAAITGITLGTDAPALMRALYESTAFGARAIIEAFEDGGVEIKKIMAIGGVARKSVLGMQILADVTNRDIYVTAGDQAPSVGAAAFAAKACGLYASVFDAQKAMSPGVSRVHHPDAKMVSLYDKLYLRYKELGAFSEGVAMKKVYTPKKAKSAKKTK